MKPFIDVAASQQWQKAQKAYEKMKQRQTDHSDQEQKIRKELDTATEKLSDAEVAYEMDEISKKELNKVKKAHEKKQQELVQHCQRSEPLQQAAQKMEVKFADVRAEQINKAQAKVYQEYINRLKKMNEAINDFKAEIENVQDLTNGLHPDIILPRHELLKFKAIRTQPGGKSLRVYQQNIQEKIQDNE